MLTCQPNCLKCFAYCMGQSFMFSVYLQMLFKGFPDGCDALKSLRNGTLEMGSSARWATEWEEHAKPLVSKAS